MKSRFFLRSTTLPMIVALLAPSKPPLPAVAQLQPGETLSADRSTPQRFATAGLMVSSLSDSRKLVRGDQQEASAEATPMPPPGARSGATQLSSIAFTNEDFEGDKPWQI